MYSLICRSPLTPRVEHRKILFIYTALEVECVCRINLR